MAEISWTGRDFFASTALKLRRKLAVAELDTRLSRFDELGLQTRSRPFAYVQGLREQFATVDLLTDLNPCPGLSD